MAPGSSGIGQLYVYAGERTPILVGKIERTGKSWPPAERSSRFRYYDGWLRSADAFPIDPLHLPLIPGWQEAGERRELHGAFVDAGPDSWGKKLIRARYPDTRLGAIEYLACTGFDRVGFLDFGPTQHRAVVTDGNGDPVLDPITLGLEDHARRVGSRYQPDRESLHSARHRIV